MRCRRWWSAAWGALAAGPRARGGGARGAGPAEPQVEQGTLTYQVLERQLRPGEVSLDDLERAFRETATEVAPAGPAKATPAPKAGAKPAAKKAFAEPETAESDRVANQSIRVNVDTLEHL